MSLFSFLTEEKSINIKLTNQITRMETLAHKETTTHPSSHGEDEACEGGWTPPNIRRPWINYMSDSLINVTVQTSCMDQRRRDR